MLVFMIRAVNLPNMKLLCGCTIVKGAIAGTESYSEKDLNKLHILKVVFRLGVGLVNI